MIEAQEWVKYFPKLNRLQFASKGLHGSEKNMNFRFLLALNQLLTSSGVDGEFSSGYRTPKHNASVGGVPSSAHPKGLAGDIKVKTSSDRFLLLFWALRLGFTRIGIYKWGLHLDMDTDKPQHVVWYG